MKMSGNKANDVNCPSGLDVQDRISVVLVARDRQCCCVRKTNSRIGEMRLPGCYDTLVHLRLAPLIVPVMLNAAAGRFGYITKM